MPTTSVRRRIRLSRSWGLLDEICRHAAFGNAVEAKMSARAASRCCATAESPSTAAASLNHVARCFGQGAGFVLGVPRL